MEKDLHVSFVFTGASGFSFGDTVITVITDEEEVTITPEGIEEIKKDLEKDYGAPIVIISWQWFD
jgi:hypothetical protein